MRTLPASVISYVVEIRRSGDDWRDPTRHATAGCASSVSRSVFRLERTIGQPPLTISVREPMLGVATTLSAGAGVGTHRS
jgi:hypothetical protein